MLSFTDAPFHRKTDRLMEGRMMRRLWCAGTTLAMILLQTPADAREREASMPSKALDDLAGCVEINADADRLACFDRTAKTIVAAQRAKDFVVLDRAEVQRTKRSLFGFSLPSINLFGGGKDEQALAALSGVMRSSTTLPGGLIRFDLDDGSVWETTEQVMLAPRRGDQVTIKAGALGSYVATAPNRRSARVRRLR